LKAAGTSVLPQVQVEITAAVSAFFSFPPALACFGNKIGCQFNSHSFLRIFI